MKYMFITKCSGWFTLILFLFVWSTNAVTKRVYTVVIFSLVMDLLAVKYLEVTTMVLRPTVTLLCRA